MDVLFRLVWYAGPWFHAVGAWLVTYLIHSTLLIVGVWAVVRYAQPSLASQDVLWKLALTGGLFTSLAQVVLGVSADASWTVLLNVLASPAGEPALGRAVEEERRFWQDIVVGAIVLSWSVVAGWRLVGVLRREIALRRLLRGRSDVSDAACVALFEEVRRRFRKASSVRLSRSGALSSPAVIGRAEICVPEHLFFRLTRAQQAALFAHELAHVQRRDHAWLKSAAAVHAVFFFQPLTRFVRHRARAVAEFLADEAALRCAGDRRALADSLAYFAAHVGGGGGLPFAAFADRASLSVERVRRVLYGQPEGSSVGRPSVLASRYAAAIVCMLVVFFAPGVAAPASVVPVGSAAGGEERLDREVEIVRARIDPRTRQVVTVAPGGFVYVTERSGKGERQVRVEATLGGELTYAYAVDGRARPFDREARAWLVDALGGEENE